VGPGRGGRRLVATPGCHQPPKEDRIVKGTDREGVFGLLGSISIFKIFKKKLNFLFFINIFISF
jgi:hypothetical protein